MNKNAGTLVLLVLVFVLGTSCSDREAEARSIFNQALSAQREGNQEEARKLFEKLVAEYSESEIATEANEKLAGMDALDLFTSSMSIAANEEAASNGIRTIVTCQILFSALNEGAYAANLSKLESAELLDSELVSGSKDGYRFNMVVGGGSFTVTATPLEFGTTGNRSFFSDETGVVRYEMGEVFADRNSPSL
jgi:type IV pilus assembly protein PilA